MTGNFSNPTCIPAQIWTLLSTNFNQPNILILNRNTPGMIFIVLSLMNFFHEGKAKPNIPEWITVVLWHGIKIQEYWAETVFEIVLSLPMKRRNKYIKTLTAWKHGLWRGIFGCSYDRSLWLLERGVGKTQSSYGWMTLLSGNH